MTQRAAVPAAKRHTLHMKPTLAITNVTVAVVCEAET